MAISDMERAAANLRRDWAATEDNWHDNRRHQAAVEFFDPTFDLSQQTLASLRAITEQVQRCMASLRLP
jgi:hypothetical protein